MALEFLFGLWLVAWSAVIFIAGLKVGYDVSCRESQRSKAGPQEPPSE